MGDIQPLGSEKLQGTDKIKRILEIAKFRESIPNPINETSRNDYKISFTDGNEYQIVKERQGYIIKKTISESVTEYIEPMKSRKYYSSYSQALKRLNLMIKENNELTGNKENISLFSEQKRYTLKTPRRAGQRMDDEVENVPAPEDVPAPPPPAPAPSAAPSPAPAPAPEDDTAPAPPPPSPEGGMGVDDVEGEGEETPEGDEMMGQEDTHEGVVTFKTIQKLVGKLGQKLRSLESQGDEPLSSKDIKYVINSVLSALDLSKMDSEDIEEITSKFEDIDSEGGEGPMSDFEDEEEGDESEDEGSSETESQPSPGEVGESWTDFGSTVATKTLGKSITPGQHHEDHYHKVNMIADELFTESKVEDILSRYYIVSESEKKQNLLMRANRQAVKKENKKNLAKEIKRLSESLEQEIASRKFAQHYSDAKFIGKTNKRNLVFESQNKQYKITPDGNII